MQRREIITQVELLKSHNTMEFTEPIMADNQ